MHNSDFSHIYIGDKGLTVEEVRLALGETTRDVAALCSSGRINPYAECKPSELEGFFGILTDAQRKAANYGVDVRGSLQNGCSSTDIMSLINKAIAKEGEWQHGVPSTILRLQDFDGYRRDAVKAYGLIGPSRGGATATFQLSRSQDGIHLIDFGDLVSAGDLSSCNLAVIAKRRGTGFILPIKASGRTTLDQLPGEDERITVDFGSVSGQVYEVYDCIFAVEKHLTIGQLRLDKYWYYPVLWTYAVSAYDGKVQFAGQNDVSNHWIEVSMSGIYPVVDMRGALQNFVGASRYARVTLRVYSLHNGATTFLGSTDSGWASLGAQAVALVSLHFVSQIALLLGAEVAVSIKVEYVDDPTGRRPDVYWCHLGAQEEHGMSVEWPPVDDEEIVPAADL